MSNQAIRAEKINRSFGEGESYVEVIKDASFVVNKGELVALVAPSGAGKTTLLMMIGCVDTPIRVKCGSEMRRFLITSG